MSLYYILVYVFFFNTPKITNEQILKDRFGTTLWHTSDRSGIAHVYCYYPGKGSDSKQLILKKVSSFSDCKGWHGITILYEDPWISEKEKYFPSTT